MEEQKGFLGALFDFSFSDFITIKLIKIFNYQDNQKMKLFYYEN